MQKKIIFIYLIILLSTLLGKLIWVKIYIPYPENIETHNANNFFYKQHPMTDFLRFIAFVTIPLFLSLLIFLKIKFFNLNNLNFILKDDVNEKLESSDNTLKLFFFFIFLLIIIDFLCLKLNYQKVDIFHEGQTLSASLNSIIKSEFFLSSKVYVGFFYEILSGILSKKIFGELKISNLRLFFEFINFITLLFFLLLIYKISHYQNFNENKKLIFFIVLSFLAVFFFKGNSLNFRDFPSILFLIVLFLYLHSKNKIYILFLGFLLPVSFFYSIDRAVFINFCSFFFLTFLIIKKKKSEILLFIISLFLVWFLIYAIAGNQEFKLFLQDTFFVLQHSGWIQDIPYPTPFTNEDNSTRGTKALLYCILSGLIILHIFLTKNLIQNELKYFYLFYFILSILNFSTALSRSDGPHIRYVESFQFLFFLILVMSIILNYEIKIFRNYFLTKFNNKLKILFLIVLFFLIFKTDLTKLKNISRFFEYKNLDNNFFLTKDQILLVSKLKPIIHDEKCVQIFTHETGLSYLLNKPSCSRNYKIFTIGTVENQKKYINDIKNNANYIIADGNYWLDISNPKVYYPIVNRFIENNYKLDFKVLEWSIYKKK